MLQLCYLYLHFTKHFFQFRSTFLLTSCLDSWPVCQSSVSVQAKVSGSQTWQIVSAVRARGCGKRQQLGWILGWWILPHQTLLFYSWSQSSPLVLWLRRNCHVFTGFYRNGSVHESGNLFQARDQERLSKISLLSYLTFHPLNQSHLQHLI